VRIVFDTNIFISAFAIPGGNAEEVHLHAIQGTFELITAVAILTDTVEILQAKFDWSGDKAEELVKTISRTATVLKTRPHLHVLQDERDNRILECAMAAQADYLVTGDRHLLALRRYKSTLLLPLAEFLALLRKA
jgi:putative PIN family toxin of toxin-antitoxin system